jgi:hypothetical protein
MTAAELRAARDQLALEPDAMAAQIGVTPHVYAAFEAGALTIPPRYAQVAAHLAALAAQQAALAASGLPECTWWVTWSAEVPPYGSSRLKPHLASGRAHFASCATCRARAQYVTDHCPPVPEFPVPWSHRMVGRVAGWFRRLREGPEGA